MRHRMRDPNRWFKFLFLVGITTGLTFLLPVAADRTSSRRPWVQPIVAIGLNFAVSGWVVLLNRVLNLPAFPGNGGTLPGERSLYEALGIRSFKKFVRSGWYGSIWGPSLRRGSGKPVSLESLAADMRSSEVSHTIAFVLVGVFTVFVLFTGRWLGVFWLLASNIFINAYPVMLQRYNRERIARARALEAE
ncbi:MAG: hypothetical protein ACOYMN_08215 [Roseimicrobium sp.]